MIDYELKLFAGEPLYLSKLGLIYPYTLRDVMLKGESNYRQFLNLLSINKEMFFKENDNNKDVSDFELLLLVLSSDENYLEIFVDNVSFVLKQQVEFDAKKLSFVANNKFLNKDNYSEFVNIVKLLNCIIDTEEFLTANQLANASDLVKTYLKKRKDANEKIVKQKNASEVQNNERLTMTDLISIFLIGNSNIGYKDVWDLPIYVFNNLFSRMYSFHEFNINIQALLNGAKNVKLNNWMVKLDNLK